MESKTVNYCITINAAIDQVFDLYTDNNNLHQWQNNLISYKYIKGKPGEIESVGEMTYKPVTIYETIKAKTIPTEIICHYDHTRNGVTKMFHTATTHLIENDNNTTEINLKVDQKVVGLIPRIVMKLMSGAVKKHHQSRLEDFKAFVEK